MCAAVSRFCYENGIRSSALWEQGRSQHIGAEYFLKPLLYNPYDWHGTSRTFSIVFQIPAKYIGTLTCYFWDIKFIKSYSKAYITSGMIMPQCIKEEEEEGKGGIFQSVTKWRQYEPFIQTVTQGVTWDTPPPAFKIEESIKDKTEQRPR